MTKRTRQERRQAELDERRQARRRGPQRQQRSLLLPITIGTIVLGVAAVAAFALLNQPPAAVDLEQPITQAPYELAEGRALGSADAPVTLTIWSDFQCPACGVLATETEPQLAEDYVEPGDLRIVYRDFAFLGEESTDASIGARCAEDQGRFWQFHDYLFANQAGENRGAFSLLRLEAMAERVGIDMAQYRACRDDPETRQAVLADRDEARQIPINSTPTLIVGERQFAGVPEYGQLSQAIDEALAASAP
jgi:protein-disulfide isomerase